MKPVILFLLVILLISPIACSDDSTDTKTVLPEVSTQLISSVTPTSASCGGLVISDGNGNVISRGVIWDLYPNPFYGLPTRTTDGRGPGDFTSELIDLAPNTTYYVRAYALNSAGVAYGEQIQFKTNQMIVTDADNNSYSAVKIGNQFWMAENLKTTKYNDGTDIPLNTATSIAVESAAYSWYDNDEITYKNVYGALYNYYAVETRKLCPSGWHVPTAGEFITLKDFVGSALAGGTLKEIGTTHWKSPNIDAKNSVGFTALPAGAKTPSYELKGEYTFWWASVPSGAGTGIGVSYKDATIINSGAFFPLNKQNHANGFSVRCLKD